LKEVKEKIECLLQEIKNEKKLEF